MQLFVTEYRKKDHIVKVENIDLLSQLRKVLRASIGDTIWIQSPAKEKRKMRYKLRIETWDNTTLDGTIIEEQEHESTPQIKGMIIAMPNKWDKVELISQKLTECGIDQIIFRPSERSIIKEWNEKKAERIQKIIKEAVEQSRWRNIPELFFTKDLNDITSKHQLVIFDKWWDAKTFPKSDKIYGMIGPEGGFTSRDLTYIEKYAPITMQLGKTVLRMETAAIIWARLLKNDCKL